MRKEIQEWIEKGNRTEAIRLLEEWVGKHPADEEEWLVMINNILGYYCKDMFNP